MLYYIMLYYTIRRKRNRGPQPQTHFEWIDVPSMLSLSLRFSKQAIWSSSWGSGVPISSVRLQWALPDVGQAPGPPAMLYYYYYYYYYYFYLLLLRLLLLLLVQNYFCLLLLLLLLTTTDYYWLLLTTTDYYWLLLTTTDYYWLLLTTTTNANDNDNNNNNYLVTLCPFPKQQKSTAAARGHEVADERLP